MEHIEKMPLISVIIPAYNAEKTIRRACDSVLSQPQVNTELIIVNDGSRDATAQILTQLAEEHTNIRCIHQENGGVCKARNTGLEAASGDCVVFLDADDELAPGCLEKLLTVMQAHSCDIVAGPAIRIRPDGTRTPTPYDLDGAVLIWEGEKALQGSLKDHPATYSVWGKLYRREVVENVRFVEGKRIHEDSFFLFEVFRRNVKMAVTNETTVLYYMTENSASRTGMSDKFLDILYFADKKYEIVEREYPQYLPLAKNVLVKASMAVLKVMWSDTDRKYKGVEEQCIRTVLENREYFVPAIKVDKILFLFIRLRLFRLYKQIYRLARGK